MSHHEEHCVVLRSKSVEDRQSVNWKREGVLLSDGGSLICTCESV